jgi:uncharacterized membrane protein YhhN
MKQHCLWHVQVLAGLIFSCAGDAFMVWKSAGYFLPGVVMFAVAQVNLAVSQFIQL